jgi:uncharacterized protein YcfJ
MEAIKTTRIHPLMAGAAVSVIVVSLVGTAAIAGLLPNSHSEPATPLAAMQPAAALVAAPQVAPALQPVQAAYAPPAPGTYAQPGAYVQPAAYAQPLAAAQAQPAPVVIKETIIREVPVQRTTPKPRPVHVASRSYSEAPVYREPTPRPAAQPNYVAIGTGAVVGGLLGNQVGGGNGKKLATIAGVIGGGFLGNQIASQNR